MTKPKELIVDSETMEVTGEVLPEDQIPESMLIPKGEKQEEQNFEQQQFDGTDGWGFIEVHYSDGNIKMKFVQWEVEDKFFHIKEKGLEKEEGIYIPLSKLTHFKFYRRPPIENSEKNNNKTIL